MYVSLSIDTGELVATLRGHAASVKSLSVHSSGRLLLAVSSRDCVLWDLDSFSRHRTLNGGQDVGVQDVSSLPLVHCMYTLSVENFVFLEYLQMFWELELVQMDSKSTHNFSVRFSSAEF